MEPVPNQSNISKWLGHTTVAGVSAIPLLGGPASVLVQSILGTAHQAKMNQFLEEIKTTIERHGFQLDVLSAHGLYRDSFLRAIRAAESTSTEQKLNALRNSVTRTAEWVMNLLKECDGVSEHVKLTEERIMRFIGFIEQMQPIHLALLHHARSVLDEDMAAGHFEDGKPVGVIELGYDEDGFVFFSGKELTQRLAYPEIDHDYEAFDRALDDLHSWKLLEQISDRPNPWREGAQWFVKLSDLGHDFAWFALDWDALPRVFDQERN